MNDTNASHSTSFMFAFVPRPIAIPFLMVFSGGSFSSFRAIRGCSDCSPSVRPSVHPQVDVVSQKRKKVEWGITNELVRPSVGQVRSGGGREGGREGEAAPVGMYGHMSPVSVRPSSDVEGPQTATDDAEVQPWISFLLLKKQLRSCIPIPFSPNH